MDHRRRGAEGRARDAVRRAEILRSYAALDKPTTADAGRAAAELGMSPGYFKQLARAWRIHGEQAVAAAALAGDPDRIARALAAAEAPLDLSGVAPARREEVARRIGVIARHLRGGTPGGEAARRAAEEFGASRSAFGQIVRQWILTPEAASIPGARIATSPGIGGVPLGEHVGRIVSAAIEGLGSEAGGTELHRRVAEACAAEGLVPPAPATVHLHAMRSRARASAASSSPDVAVCLDRLALLVDPSAPADGPVVVLRILFARPSGRILAHELSSRPPAAEEDARMIAAHLEGDGEGGTSLLELGLPAGDAWDALRSTLREAGVDVWTTPRGGLYSARLAFGTFGNRIGGTTIRRLVPETLARLSSDPADLAAAAAAMAAAVAEHNAARSAPPIGLEPRAGRSVAAELLAAVFGG